MSLTTSTLNGFLHVAKRPVTSALNKTGYSVHQSYIHTSTGTTNRLIQTQPVPESQAGFSAMPNDYEHPIVIRSPKAHNVSESPSHSSSSGSLSRANALMDALREGTDRLVDVEYGRYDRVGAFDRITMRVGQYLDWLEGNTRDGKIDGKQVYLAQWRAGDELPSVSRLLQTPQTLKALLVGGMADLYQTSFFVGPSGAISPLHYDPYINLYHLQASSSPTKHAKHFTLFSPSSSNALKSPDSRSVYRNTSPIELHLSQSRDRPGEFNTFADPSVPSNTVEGILDQGFSCVLYEGDTLLIPRGWWHRVENVSMGDKRPDEKVGWTAGVAWWFLLKDRLKEISN